MSRLIDADALISDLEFDIKMDQDSLDYEDLSDVNRKLIQNDKDCKQNAVDILKSTPTVDAVPVVRCGECRHKYLEHDVWTCRFGLLIPSPDGFCSYGEKVTE